MDFKKLGERMARHDAIKKRLGDPIWTYRCTRNVGCRDTETVLALPAHMLVCFCDICYHNPDGGKSHRSPCNAPIVLVERNAAAVALDDDKGAA